MCRKREKKVEERGEKNQKFRLPAYWELGRHGGKLEAAQGEKKKMA